MGAFIAIKENTDFRTAYYRGKSQVHPLLVTYVRRNRLGVTRVGITAGKKVGKAVRRNRCRRIIRAAYQALQPEVRCGYDIVFVARVRTGSSTSTQVQAAMQAQLRALGVYGPGGKGGCST